MSHNRSKKPLIITASVLTGTALLLAGGGTAYAMHYAERVLPGTTVAGHDVAGLERADLEKVIEDLAQKVRVTSNVGGTTREASLADLGVTVDIAKTADSVMSPNASIIERFRALIDPAALDVVAETDSAKLDRYVTELSSMAGEAVQQASIVANEDGTFSVTPARPGKTIEVDAFKAAVTSAQNTLTPQSVDLNIVDVEPSLTTAEAQATADAAAELVSTKVNIASGARDRAPTKAEKAQWVKFNSADGNNFDALQVDEEAVKTWVRGQAEEANTAPVAAIQNVDANGKVLVTSRKGSDGREVNNADVVAAGIVQALNAKEAYDGKFEFNVLKVPAQQRQALPGAQNFAYPAAAGERWIDINLSNNTITAYEGQTIVHGPTAMNHGRPHTPTITGIYNVWHKTRVQDMGCKPDFDYCAKDVPYSTFFHGDFAVHGAPWAHEFGTGRLGSNGCINLPVSEAKWYWEYMEMGMPVASHR